VKRASVRSKAAAVSKNAPQVKNVRQGYLVNVFEVFSLPLQLQSSRNRPKVHHAKDPHQIIAHQQDLILLSLQTFLLGVGATTVVELEAACLALIV